MRYAVIGASVEQVRDAGGSDLRESRATGMVFATLSESQADQLRSQGYVVNSVAKVKADVMPPAPVIGVPTYSPEELVWAVGFEDLRGLTEPPLYGEGFNLAIIDTGIRETHQKIRGRVAYRKNLSADPPGDGFDHGTGVASIAVAVAPRCNLLDIKVLDNKGNGTEEDVVMGIDEVLSLHDAGSEFAPWVINLSLGGPDDGNPNNALRVACRAALARGIWVMAAAGNLGPDPSTVMSPACEQYVVAVGSAKYEPFSVSGFSSRGPSEEGVIKPDAVMFGEDIAMASSQSDTAVTAKSGTSFATPFAAGMAVLYHEAILAYHGVQYPEGVPPGLDPEITELISVTDLIDVYLFRICVKPQGSEFGKDVDYGYGLPFGPLIADSLRQSPALDIATPLNAMMFVNLMSMLVGSI